MADGRNKDSFLSLDDLLFSDSSEDDKLKKVTALFKKEG